MVANPNRSVEPSETGSVVQRLMWLMVSLVALAAPLPHKALSQTSGSSLDSGPAAAKAAIVRIVPSDAAKLRGQPDANTAFAK